MHLSSIQIDRFRGLRRCLLRFDRRTTVVIGENNCGKSSILDALDLLLSPRWLADDSPIGPLDFHRGTSESDREPQTEPGPIRIALTFSEHDAGEWTDDLLARLGDAVWRNRHGGGHVRLRGEAAPIDDDGACRRTVQALGGDGQPLDVDAVALHDTLRRIKPVVRLRTDRTLAQGPLDAFRAGGAKSDDPDPDLDAAPAAPSDDRGRADIGTRLAELHDALVESDGGWPDLAAELRSLGELLALEPEEIAAVGGSSDRLIEILRDRAVRLSGRLSVGGGPPLPLSRQGVGTQALVLVLLLGALLAGGAHGLDPLADPLTVLEDPEAHLHPRTLAHLARSVAALRGQKLVVTHSGDLLTVLPMEAIRRLHRRGDDVRVHQLDPQTLGADESRKVNYHIRSRRRSVLFARCWLLVEGETEFWLLPPLAQRLGFELTLEGVACVEFAQCGLKPLIKTALDLGIQWHLLADGDAAGSHYATAAADWIGDEPPARRITTLGSHDIEAALWHHGYAQIYRDAAGLVGRKPRSGENPDQIIAKAIRSASKPSLAQRIIDALAVDGSPGTPPALAKAIQTAVELARAEGSPPRRRRK